MAIDRCVCLRGFLCFVVVYIHVQVYGHRLLMNGGAKEGGSLAGCFEWNDSWTDRCFAGQAYEQMLSQSSLNVFSVRWPS